MPGSSLLETVVVDTRAVRIDTMDDHHVVGEPIGTTEPHEMPSGTE